MIAESSRRKTDRRKLRQAIRNVLGSSNTQAPSLSRVAQAAQLLDGLLRLTTDDQWRLVAHCAADGSVVMVDRFAEMILEP